MVNFLSIGKQNITVLKGLPIHINAHFITDTSQSWIFSNTKAEEGVCEVHIHYISPENNKKMMMEQPLWRGYLAAEIPDEGMKAQMLEHINQPILHVILNVYQDYKYMASDLVDFVYRLLKKKNDSVEEIVMDTFIYSEVIEWEGDNI
ncbi:hypothetical protein [Thermotalea metallivorans]|uniref:Uncharacterized protein n=1 Tax=Thermotalea metallivorans TaxID=520762 RepID=A0A140L2A6_9FIRM|nr:hypothetical protein [Thermotalea metallivorans]KXG74681.1 hypothetical protein AN619_21880 [Thermotalea metallivorans]